MAKAKKKKAKAGTSATKHLDLRPTLDLEEPDRVACTDGIVDGFIFEVDAAQVRGLAFFLCDEFDAFFDQREHTERQKVDLYKARIVARILVPLTHHPIRHGGPF